MPRRYSDYPDVFIKWHVVSSMGSTISFVALLYFMFLLWEMLVSQRGVVSSRHMPTRLEWAPRLPVPFHGIPATTLIRVMDDTLALFLPRIREK